MFTNRSLLYLIGIFSFLLVQFTIGSPLIDEAKVKDLGKSSPILPKHKNRTMLTNNFLPDPRNVTDVSCELVCNDNSLNSDDVLYCIDVLYNIGKTACVVHDNGATAALCYHGTTYVSGRALDNQGTWSLRSDVSIGLSQIWQQCTGNAKILGGMTLLGCVD